MACCDDDLRVGHDRNLSGQQFRMPNNSSVLPKWLDLESFSFALNLVGHKQISPVLATSRDKATESYNKQITIRFTHVGSSLKHGKLIRLSDPRPARPLTGEQIISSLRENGNVDTDRFQPYFFDENNGREAWAKILPQTEVFVAPSRRLDIRLEDSSVRPGAIARAQTLALKSSVKDPGYFGIGVYRLKTEANHGTLWRSAFQFGADFIFTIGTGPQLERNDYFASIANARIVLCQPSLILIYALHTSRLPPII